MIMPACAASPRSDERAAASPTNGDQRVSVPSYPPTALLRIFSTRRDASRTRKVFRMAEAGTAHGLPLAWSGVRK